MIDVKELLRELREEPYEKVVIRAPHCGRVEFVTSEPGARVTGPGGTWKEKPGTLLARLEREKSVRPLHAPQKGELMCAPVLRSAVKACSAFGGALA